MMLLPRTWRLGRARSVVSGLAWLLVAVGMHGHFRQACGADGWGAFILVGIGLLRLLAVSAPGVSATRRPAMPCTRLTHPVAP